MYYNYLRFSPIKLAGKTLQINAKKVIEKQIIKVVIEINDIENVLEENIKSQKLVVWKDSYN